MICKTSVWESLKVVGKGRRKILLWDFGSLSQLQLEVKFLSYFPRFLRLDLPQDSPSVSLQTSSLKMPPACWKPSWKPSYSPCFHPLHAYGLPSLIGFVGVPCKGTKSGWGILWLTACRAIRFAICTQRAQWRARLQDNWDLGAWSSNRGIPFVCCCMARSNIAQLTFYNPSL